MSGLCSTLQKNWDSGDSTCSPAWRCGARPRRRDSGCSSVGGGGWAASAARGPAAAWLLLLHTCACRGGPRQHSAQQEPRPRGQLALGAVGRPTETHGTAPAAARASQSAAPKPHLIDGRLAVDAQRRQRAPRRWERMGVRAAAACCTACCAGAQRARHYQALGSLALSACSACAVSGFAVSRVVAASLGHVLRKVLEQRNAPASRLLAWGRSPGGSRES